MISLGLGDGIVTDGPDGDDNVLNLCKNNNNKLCAVQFPGAEYIYYKAKDDTGHAD